MKLVDIFKYGQPIEFRLIAQDEQGHVSIKEFFVNITYPLNVAIHTAQLTGESDSQVTPISTVTDADGEVIEAIYNLKNYIYLKTDRQTLLDINAVYSLDNTNWQNVNFNVITVSSWDYIKISIPVYNQNVFCKILDLNLNSFSRVVLFRATSSNPN